MSGKKRRKFTPEEIMAILRKHLLDKVPVSEVCDEHGLNPTVFYRWQKQLFEQGSAAFERHDDGRARKLAQENAALKTRLSHRDEVIAEIMESHVALKKTLGEA